MHLLYTPSESTLKYNVSMTTNPYQPYLPLIIIFSIFLAFSCSTESTPIYQLSVNNESIEGGNISTSSLEAEEGDSITVTAVPDEHFKFVSWGGDYSGTENPMTIIMDSDKTLIAIFEKVDYPLTVHTQGEGSVKEEIIQPKSTEYQHGTWVKLTAEPEYGWEFVEWQGGASGSDLEIEVEIDGPVEITAVFERVDFEVTVHVEGQGNVNKEVVQAKSTDYPFETQLQLTAEAEYGWTFAGWSGDASGSDNVIIIDVDEDLEITATFKRLDFGLTVHTQGQGNVSQEVVQSKSTDYAFESLVQLTAVPANGWKFSEWSGDASGSDTKIIIEIDKDKEITATFYTTPTISTTDVNNITQTSARSGGNISNNGGASVTERGICWSTQQNPNENNGTCIVSGSGSGTFTVDMSSLEPGTTYYVNAYAKNSAGTGRGNPQSFTTLQPLTITTKAISSVTSVSAESGGEISHDGGSPITQRGICWNNSPDPTLQNSIHCTQQGSGTGSFSTELTGLASLNNYWVRAYATNSQGTTYGNQVSFTTLRGGGGGSDDGGSDDGGSDDGGSDDGGSDDGGGSTPPPPSDPPPPGSTTVLIMFSPASLENSDTPTGAVDVNVNGTWHNFSSSFSPNSFHSSIGQGVVLHVDERVTHIEVRQSQIRKRGLNNDCYGFTTLKMMQKHPDFNAYNINSNPNSPSYWAASYDGRGRLVERGSVNYLVDEQSASFYRQNITRMTESGKFMLWVTGVGEDHGGYLNPNSLLDGAPGLYPTGRTTALPACSGL